MMKLSIKLHDITFTDSYTVDLGKHLQSSDIIHLLKTQ